MTNNHIPKGKENLFNQGKIGIQNCIATPKTIKKLNTTLKQTTGIIKKIFFKLKLVSSFIVPLIHLTVNDIGAMLITAKIKVNQATTITFIILYSYIIKLIT